MISSVEECKIIQLPVHERGSAKLAAVSISEEVPWALKRVFIIETNLQENRGDHAHKCCSQFFIRTAGIVEINCRDGISEKNYVLATLNQALLVPPGIWVKLAMGSQSAVTVLTDQHYDRGDYINDWEEFLEYKDI